MISLQKLLCAMIEKDASDLHITIGSPPRIRIDGHLCSLEDCPPLTHEETKKLTYSIMTETQKREFEELWELDFSFGIKGVSRFRANAYRQRGAVAIAIRTIPYKIKSFEELMLPKVVAETTEKPRGLVLITGPTGSGKSTTLAAIIDSINRKRRSHIVTIEDPIEYIHQHKNCLVNQREVNADTKSFTNALRSVLRQDPDIILIGEMRDLETMEAAITVAETGHLTFATLHTNSCAQTINRIIDAFPSYQQPQIRAQLSLVLQGVFCQQLIAKSYESGRVMAMEIMIPNAAIRNLIREDKIHQIYGMMQSGQGDTGMQTMNQSIVKHFVANKISFDEAMAHSSEPKELENILSKSSNISKKKGGTIKKTDTKLR